MAILIAIIDTAWRCNIEYLNKHDFLNTHFADLYVHSFFLICFTTAEWSEGKTYKGTFLTFAYAWFCVYWNFLWRLECPVEWSIFHCRLITIGCEDAWKLTSKPSHQKGIFFSVFSFPIAFYFRERFVTSFANEFHFWWEHFYSGSIKPEAINKRHNLPAEFPCCNSTLKFSSFGIL